MIDFTAIKPYSEGKITREDAAKRLMCTPDYVDEFIRSLTEDVNDVEHERRENLRRFGSARMTELEHWEDLERRISPLNIGGGNRR